jgi:polysaccharide export outer membrane protein
MFRIIFLFVALIGVSACSVIPRGAGLRSEVLAPSRADGVTSALGFSVEPVTQENLLTYQSWPAVNGDSFPWLNRVDRPNTRTIAGGDRLQITVWTNEENGLLTNIGQRFVTLPVAQVSAAGDIFLPYVDNIHIHGLSAERAREVIEERYQTVSPAAQVQLKLTEGRQRTISLIGGVAKPGSFALQNNDYTILELLADAGGVSAGLKNPQIRLHRKERIFGTSLKKLLKTPKMNTTLLGADRIFVEKDERSFLSLGAAGTEAVHSFPTDKVSALEALAIIGGVSDDRADAKGILILRRYPDRKVTLDRTGPDHARTIFTLDLTSADGLFSADQFLIHSGDLIYVSESPVTAARSILSIFGTILGLSNSI